ncbi:hypothetical protein [uncultured Proteiniphilum sp.]|uniref:hypothetical protein n=1 Tax=uncultured Proteiniphilum sp. TaxID=497637 RepID=UPI00344BFFBD
MTPSTFIYYGPHIGISRDGHIGKRQSELSNCCGAAPGALDKLLNNIIEKGKAR